MVKEARKEASMKTVLVFETNVDGCGTNVPVAVSIPADADYDQLTAELNALKASPDSVEFSTDDYVEAVCQSLYGAGNFSFVPFNTVEF